MTLSIQAARRKEYPELAEDYKLVTEAGKTKEVKVRVPITDVFYLMFRDPLDGLFKRLAISYDKKKTRIFPEDIRNFEAETNGMPVLVQKELYYAWNEVKQMWEDIKGAKNHFSHYFDCTEDYKELWRPNAYPKGSEFEDPFKGKQWPGRPDAMEVRAHMQARRISLYEAKERGLVTPMSTTNTGHLIGVGGFVTHGEPSIEMAGKAAFSAGPANTNDGKPVVKDFLDFIPPTK